MQLRSGATYANMSSQNTSNNQDPAIIRLEEISATQQSHQDAIIQLSSKLDEIMKNNNLAIEDETTSHQFKHLPS